MKLTFRVIAATLALTLGAAPALHAQESGNLFVSSTYNTIWMSYGGGNYSEGGGHIAGSYIGTAANHDTLDYLYCVDMFKVIYVPVNYAATTWNSDAVIGGGAVQNAGNIEYLMDRYAESARVTADDDTAAEKAAKSARQIALQAAIWTVAYAGSATPVTLGVGNGSAVASLYAEFMAAVNANGPATVTPSSWLWFTPKHTAGEVYPYQGLVGGFYEPGSGGSSVVPEAGSLVLLLPGLAPLALALRRRAKRA